MYFEELLLPIGLECPRELFGVSVSAIVTDSRKAMENSIFICVEGKNDDGHRHIGEALSAGAKVIVAESVRNECEGGAALLYAENTRRIASLLYNLWYGNPVSRMKFIGVTGTNGKTSISYILYEILESAGYKTGLIGTVEYLSFGRRKIHREGNMTTPDPETLYSTLRRMSDDGVEYVIMEVSSHALAQHRTDPINFEVAVFTNLTEEHLDFHSDMEDYYKAKERLFLQTQKAVVNIDCEAGRRLDSFLRDRGVLRKTCSCKEGAFCALNAKCDESGIEYVLVKDFDKCNSIRVKSSLLGEFQIMNSLEAIAAAELCGIDATVSSVAIEGLTRISGRLERVKSVEDDESEVKVFIDFAHTPDALERLLRSVRAMTDRSSRIIILFGCGGDRDKGKRKEMGRIASRLADFVVVTSDNSRSEDPKSIIKDILKGIDKEKEFAVIESRKEAITKAIVEYARDRDIVILSGKGHEDYEIGASGKHPFNEKEIALEALGARTLARQERKRK
ncbi:MAG: UDP-N-acetylmuramoyl-L-alanyl-D-glutamate--2,6-diaminopimelate ligase [Clostridia bacterium]|nr:UDP-N-acetylmuramoyl-L-alanyl-D-glutamate--2,6-diaminopimelate ligase [Clostridia bacterium]